MERKQVAGEKEAGQPESVGNLLRARLRFRRRVLAQERGQRQQPIAPGRSGLGAHGEEALRIHPPAPGERALDIGCGFGDTTRQIAELVGPEGSVLGFDVSERFIGLAREEAEADAVANARFAVGDLQVTEFEQT